MTRVARTASPTHLRGCGLAGSARPGATIGLCVTAGLLLIAGASCAGAVVWQHALPRSEVPRALVLSTSALGRGCPGDGVGIGDGLTVPGAPVRIIVPGAAEASWLDGKAQCRLLLIEEGKGLHRLRRSEQLFPQVDEAFEPPIFSCGYFRTIVTKAGVTLWTVSGCGATVVVTEDALLGPDGEVLVAVGREIGPGRTGPSHVARHGSNLQYSYEPSPDAIAAFLVAPDLEAPPIAWNQ